VLREVLQLRADTPVSGLLQNGNFECPPDQNQMNGSAVTGEYALPNWKVSGCVEYVQSGQQQGDIVLTVPEGAHAVLLGNDASVEQQVGVTMGMHYSFSFAAARTCGQSQKLRVSILPGSQVSEFPIQTVYSSSGWDFYSWALKAECNSVTFVIHNPGQEEDPACGPIIDSVAIKTMIYPPQATQSKRNVDELYFYVHRRLPVAQSTVNIKTFSAIELFFSDTCLIN
jgi:hypothetical protein